MKLTLKGMIIPLAAIIIFLVVPGCTPGKAQTRGNDYKGSFETEEFEAFDSDGGSDDEIPPYRENRKVSSSGKNTPSGREYDNNIAKIKKDYDRGNRSSEGYNDSRNGAYRDTESSGRNAYGHRDDYSSSDSSDRGERFFQEGKASWYGREFHGRTTASGEKFDMNSMTAAHKTLPFGTVIEVKNLENGKTVRLKVNDRGPYRGERILDVSFGAAKELDMVRAGEAPVGITVLRQGDSKYASGNTGSAYVEPVSDEDYPDRRVRSGNSYDYADSADMKLQAGAFYSRKNAEQLKSRIEDLTDRPVRIVQDGEFFKVRIEGLRNRGEMNRLKDSLGGENISSFSVE